jgi:hypothetical protein
LVQDRICFAIYSSQNRFTANEIVKYKMRV